jgi:hypothetical protein
MTDITLLGAGYIALIVALVQVCKSFGLKGEYAALAAVVFGLLSAFGLDGLTVTATFTGLASGLTAVGLYEVGGGAVAAAVGGK